MHAYKIRTHKQYIQITNLNITEEERANAETQTRKLNNPTAIPAREQSWPGCYPPYRHYSYTRIEIGCWRGPTPGRVTSHAKMCQMHRNRRTNWSTSSQHEKNKIYRSKQKQNKERQRENQIEDSKPERSRNTAGGEQNAVPVEEGDVVHCRYSTNCGQTAKDKTKKKYSEHVSARHCFC